MRLSASHLWVLCLSVTLSCATTARSTSEDGTPTTKEDRAPATSRATGMAPLPRVVLKPNPSRAQTTNGITQPTASFTRGEVQAVLSRGPGALLQSVRVQPFLKNNKFLGFQILWVNSEHPRFQAPYLQVGDTILRVNGVRIRRPEDYLTAFHSLKTAEAVEFDIWRGEERLLIEYRIIDP